nr:hypothetical protein [Haliscomenobacter sp.]
MKRIIPFFACTGSYLAIFAQDAKEIVKKADERAKGETSIATITVQKRYAPPGREKWSIKSWTKGNDLMLI